MDFELEKQKASYIHKLEIRKLILDKLLFGFIIVALGFVANFFVEHYRSQSIKDRFVLEKRLEAVQNIGQAYMKMHNDLDSTSLQGSITNDDRSRLESNKQNYINVWTEWSIILSKKYRSELDYITWIYIALQSYELQTMRTYRKYLFDLYYKFNAMCREELGFLKEPEMATFKFVEWPASKADYFGADEFFRVNYEEWLRSKKKE